MFQTLKKMFGGKKEAAEVLSPVSGSVVPLSEVNDPAFAQAVQGFFNRAEVKHDNNLLCYKSV